jgi:Carboxypeptidase regulatory-like domain
VHRPQWTAILCTAGLAASTSIAFGGVQESAPSPSPPATTPAQQAPAASSSKPGKQKYSHANDFLIHGTVFTDKALSFPGVQLRIRKAGEKKFRWESYTDSRGEFAVRVPQGSDYEMVVRAKGFAEQTRAVDAKTGANEGNLVFRMQPAAGGKG